MAILGAGTVLLALAIGLVVVIREGRLKRELQEHRDRLAALAVTDPLTGLANRRRFDEFFDLEWHQAVRSGLPLSMVLVDVDHFKLYNDEYGHANGDECLKAVADAISGVMVRSTDLAARFGGEEFICALSDTDSRGALKVAENIRAAVENLKMAHIKSRVAGYVTVSVGVTTVRPTGTDEVDVLFEECDKRLYQAKHDGRNRVVGEG